jgi:hypothetical protein
MQIFPKKIISIFLDLYIIQDNKACNLVVSSHQYS